jgi:hypothetical protein
LASDLPFRCAKFLETGHIRPIPDISGLQAGHIRPIPDISGTAVLTG